jgi:hypothetical protein
MYYMPLREVLRDFSVALVLRQTFGTEQRFRDHAELLAKVTVQGAMATLRVQRFASATNIVSFP